MANMQANYPNIFPNGVNGQTSSSCRGIKLGEINLADFRIDYRKTAGYSFRRQKRRILERERGFMGGCCTSSPSSSTSQTWELLAGKIELGGECGDRKGQFGYLSEEYGWKVRRMVEDQSEIRQVAQVQAEAFHEPAVLFNDIFLRFFQAEVLAGLLYRLRNSPPDRYACLVAELNTNASEQHQKLVGVVDVTVLRDEAVLQHLPGADEYLYVSGIAVSNNFRRRKVATALLKACEVLSALWRFEYLVLRAYEDDWGALNLYRNAGYRIVSGDPPWMTSWIGRRRRVLMIKQPK